jgi:hypothetical protein
MAMSNAGGLVRKFVTRLAATGLLLAMYSVGTITMTGTMLTATVSSADAHSRGRRGRRGRRGWRGGERRYVCHHHYWTSGRICRGVWRWD